MAPGEEGYCVVRRGTAESLRLDGRQRARMSWYFDPLPTNCVADWVCAGGTGAGYPKYAYEDGPEVGFYNLAVFFEACNFNCLYCQNWSFKGNTRSSPWHSLEDLTSTVTQRTSCVCYFGGDPTSQLPYAIRAAHRLRTAHRDRILRICWETNGSMHPSWLKRMAQSSLSSGGCIKVDLKAWNSRVHHALCGVDNRQVLDNFVRLASFVPLRQDPPLLVASTLLVPGYVDEAEVASLASFIARLNPDIPYVLLAFAPQFHLSDFPTTSRAQAEACLEAAVKAGLRYVRVGNRHLLR
jgi:pyruvate formate lyase activating enzyme